MTQFADENISRGAADYPRWLTVEKRLRERLTRLINAPSPDDVALVKNTSEGLSFIAYGLPWKSGDEVVINGAEFPSNRVVWESLASRGVMVRDVDLDGEADPEAALLDALTARTRLLSVSSVQYGSGLRMDLERLGTGCRTRDVLFCVDAIQSLGALRFDLARTPADFVVADGHKWMLGPEGLGLFYCRAPLRENLELTQYGWHMLAHAGNYDRRDWEPAPDARRFECGSPNMLGIHALEASLAILQDTIGMEEVERSVLANSAHLCRRVRDEATLELLSESAGHRRAGIVTFRAPGVDSTELHGHLMRSGVICARRGGGVRFSPHFYNTVEQLDRAVEIAAAFARNGI